MTDAEIHQLYHLLAQPEHYRRLLATNFNATFQIDGKILKIRPLDGHFILDVEENGKWRLSICEQKLTLEKLHRQFEPK